MEDLLPPDLGLNTSFSAHQLGMQLAIDSTSLGSFKTCPRKYFLEIIWGYQSRDLGPHLTFGLLIHAARESYDWLRAKGIEHEEALEKVLKQALIETWNKELARPWISGHESKNRLSLVRTIVWYLDQFGANDPLVTVLDAAGRPLVELSFRFDSGVVTMGGGEKVSLCGHGDRIAKLNDVPYWLDVKTTKSALDPKFFNSFTPHNQFSLYDIAGKIVYELPTQGIILDGLQIGATFTRCKRHAVPRDNAQREEWLHSFGWWVSQMEHCAETRHWPMNETACDLYGGCRFRGICSRTPSQRQQWLDRDFARRIWDPLQRRGDV